MDRLKKIFATITYKPINFALFSNIIAAIVGLLFSHPFFEENDDLGMSLIAEGAYGYRNWHTLYTNVILSKFTCFLQGIVPSVRWHVVLQIIFVFAAFVCITFVLAHYRNGKALSVILQLSLFYEMYVSIQFTKTSAFIACVGVLMLIHYLGYVYGDLLSPETQFSSVSVKVLAAAGIVLMLYANMLRNHGYIVGMAFALLPGGVIWLFTMKNGGRKKLLSYLLVLAVSAGIIAVFSAVNRSAYDSDPGWAKYHDFEVARAKALDQRPDSFDYTRNAEGLAELGVSAEDAFMYVTWQIGDEAIVTSELLNDIAYAAGPKHIDVDFLKAFAASVYDDVLKFIPAFMAFILLIFVLLSASDLLSGSGLYALAEALVMLVGLLGVHYIGRWTHRLVFALIIVADVSLAFGIAVFNADMHCRPAIFKKAAKNSEDCAGEADNACAKAGIASALYVAIGFLAVTVFAQRMGNEFDYQEYLRSGQDFKVLQMYMEEEKDKLFILDTFTVQNQYRYDVFNAVSEGALDNVVSSGSWMTGTPIEHEILNRFGYSDSFDALRSGGDSNVCLIDNIFVDKKISYINAHNNGPRYASEYVEDICGYKLYRIQ